MKKVPPRPFKNFPKRKFLRQRYWESSCSPVLFCALDFSASASWECREPQVRVAPASAWAPPRPRALRELFGVGKRFTFNTSSLRRRVKGNTVQTKSLSFRQTNIGERFGWWNQNACGSNCLLSRRKAKNSVGNPLLKVLEGVWGNFFSRSSPTKHSHKTPPQKTLKKFLHKFGSVPLPPQRHPRVRRCLRGKG